MGKLFKQAGHLFTEQEVNLLEGLGVWSWGRGVIGPDEMCLLNKVLNQSFSTGVIFHSLPLQGTFGHVWGHFDCHNWSRGSAIGT